MILYYICVVQIYGIFYRSDYGCVDQRSTCGEKKKWIEIGEGANS